MNHLSLKKSKTLNNQRLILINQKKKYFKNTWRKITTVLVIPLMPCSNTEQTPFINKSFSKAPSLTKRNSFLSTNGILTKNSSPDNSQTKNSPKKKSAKSEKWSAFSTPKKTYNPILTSFTEVILLLCMMSSYGPCQVLVQTFLQ